MEQIKGNFGFGMMRLPMKDGDVDLAQTSRMVDAFLEAGFNYFDTAHGYLSGKSETAVRSCLTSRYPREAYILTNKLTKNFFQKEEDIRPLFKEQLKACGVAYFDYYLMHAQGKTNYEHYKKCRAYETAFDLKAEGKVRHVGISFHDSADMLERILQDYPQIEVVQIQFNYLDYDNPSIESKAVYDVCRSFQKPILVMEPVKGGGLSDLPGEATEIFSALGGGSAASYAIRYAASFPGIKMVLSGMSTMEQLEDNVGYMEDFQPLDDRELEAIEQVRAILKAQNTVACTACRYCVPGCPRHILIPDLFACLNTKRRYQDWSSDFYYKVNTKDHGRASDCVGCRQCERICPQHLPITQLLRETAKTFETET